MRFYNQRSTAEQHIKERVYLHAWENEAQTRVGVGRWITFYNHQRPYTTHVGQPPAVVYFNRIEAGQQVQAVA